MAEKKQTPAEERFKGIMPPETLKKILLAYKDEITDTGEPLFTVIALRSNRYTLRVQLRCNTCGYKEISFPMVLGHKFHCLECKTENEVTSVIPFTARRIGQEKPAETGLRPVCSKCGSNTKIDWQYQEIECPNCGKFEE